MSLSIVYYTANRESVLFDKVREHLLASAVGLPIISVSQKPLDFGKNICVGPIGANHYNVYWQILVGAKAAQTEYVACCEDDCLYTSEHFQIRPVGNAIVYNRWRWWIERWKESARFRFRERISMWTAIAPRDLLVQTLEERFALYTDPLAVPYNRWCEPGRRDEKLGVQKVPIEIAHTKMPILTFNHRPSLGGIRHSGGPDAIISDALDPWGKASDLWREFTEEAA